jgi:pimeloyl-ACP methyl ester carboxylesterase
MQHLIGSRDPLVAAARLGVPAASRWLWPGVSAAFIIAPLATLAVEATPHTRGLGFFSELRYAVVTPASMLLTLAAAFAYAALAMAVARPRRTLFVGLAALSACALLAVAALGPRGLLAAAWPPLLLVAAATAFLVPRWVEQPRRSRAARLALLLLGALEICGVIAALGSERPAPRGPNGLAFAVPRQLFDVEHHFLELSAGGRVHYVDEGHGPTLLFLHGNPAWSFQWRTLIHELRASHRCVALDYPGFGLSSAPAEYGYSAAEQSRVVEELVERLGLRDITLVMQDWGGPIGLDFAARRPEWVRSLVLGSTWAWPTTAAEPRGKFSVIAGGPLGEFAQMNFNGFAALGVENGIVRKLPREVLDVYLHPFRPLARRGVAAYYPGQINAATDYFAQLEGALPRLKHKPALIFWALKDAGFPRQDLERFQRAFPRHQTFELPDADHFFFEDASELMIAKLKEFVH